jgi:hypothetical protein
MNPQEIAEKLVTYCRKGEFKEAQKALYHNDVVSIEPEATPDFAKETRGLDKNLEKAAKFDSMVETVHKIEVSDPIVAGNAIAFRLDMDITMKGRGRMNMGEICAYQVKDGKIISEQFFM